MSKRNQFLGSCLSMLIAMIAVYLPVAALLGRDYVTALVAPAAILVIFPAVVVAIGRRFPDYFMYRGAIEFWSDVQAWRNRRS